MKKTILAVVGLCGSGKTEAIKFFTEKGYKNIYFGSATFDEMEKKGLEINEKNERATREEIRNQYGMGAYAILALPKIKEVLETDNFVLLESLYSWDEYKIIKNEFGENFKVLAVYSSPEARYGRLTNRRERPYSREDAQSRDYSQIENLAQAGPIAMADFTVVNTKDVNYLRSQLDEVINNLSN